MFNFAESILHGSLLFKDKPSYIFPGIFYSLALLYKIFGISFLVSRYAMAAVFSATAILVFLISRQITTERAALLTALLFVTHRIWAFPVWNMIGYATVAVFFLAIALYLLLRFTDNPRPLTVFFVGIFIAIATMFKQDYGAFAGLAMFVYILVWPNLRAKGADTPETGFSRPKATGAYVLGGLMVCLPIFAYFAQKGALDDMVRNTFLIPLSLETTRDATPLIPLLPLLEQDAYVRGNWLVYAPAVTYLRFFMRWQTASPNGFLYTHTPLWDILLKLVHYLPYLILTASAAFLLKHYFKGTFSPAHKKMTGVLLFAAALCMTQHKPFDFAHLMQMYFPVFLLLGALADAFYSGIHSRKMFFIPALGAGAALSAVYLFHTVAGISFITKSLPAKLEGPRAGIYLSEHDRDSCSAALGFIEENTSPDEHIFVLPYHSLFYFLSQRPNPTRFENVWPVKVFENMDEEIIADLEEKQVEYIVEFPQIHEGIGSYEKFAPLIAEHLRRNYALEKSFGHPYRGLHIRIFRRKADRPFAKPRPESAG